MRELALPPLPFFAFGFSLLNFFGEVSSCMNGLAPVSYQSAGMSKKQGCTAQTSHYNGMDGGDLRFT